MKTQPCNYRILDPTCGSRMMWFNKNNKDTMYTDKRRETHILSDGRALEINPDIQCDFTNLPFEDESFYLVVFDPPHLEKLGQKSWLAKKYGKLLPHWELDIKEGFKECMRVLKPNGTLVFKWNQRDVTVEKILKIIEHEPLFGHTTSKNGLTVWMSFMK